MTIHYLYNINIQPEFERNTDHHLKKLALFEVKIIYLILYRSVEASDNDQLSRYDRAKYLLSEQSCQNVCSPASLRDT